MNTSRDNGAPARAPQAEAVVAAAVRMLFQRLPRLLGFSVADAAEVPAEREAGQLEGDLSLADISTFPLGAADGCFGEIAIALIDLLDERPEARELLRGRTFTRTLQ